MTEEHGEDKYIKCSQCKCKYLNSDFHILKDFGYDRLNRRYKTCKKCRSKKQTITKDLSGNKITNVVSDYIKSIIIDFTHGDAKYWKNIFTSQVLNQLKTTRFVRTHCDCEGCNGKHYYGCYYFSEFNYRLKPTKQVLELWSMFGFGLTDDRCSFLFKDLKG